MGVSTILKTSITIVLGIALLILFFTQAVPSMLGNTTFSIWVGGTNYAWVATFLLFVMFIASLVITVKAIL